MVKSVTALEIIRIRLFRPKSRQFLNPYISQNTETSKFVIHLQVLDYLMMKQVRFNLNLHYLNHSRRLFMKVV